jgi:DNA-binding transcriptional LysR family regulator
MPINSRKRAGGFMELRAAIVVAERRSFRAAAEALGMSPTALSSAVRSLEDRLGIQLFNRTTRSVSLTSAGEEFVAHVVPPLAEIDRAMEAASSHGMQPSGTLRINTSVTATHEILLPLIRGFLDHHPLLQLELITESRLIDVVLDGCDAGIRLSESVPADMVSVPLPFGLDFCVVGAPDYLAANPAPTIPAELSRHCCIRSKTPGANAFRWEFERHGEVHLIDVPGELFLNDQSLLLKAAIAGMGLAYISRAAASDALAAGRLRTVLEDWLPPSSPLCLYYPRNRNTSAALRALIQAIRRMGPSDPISPSRRVRSNGSSVVT